MRVTGVNWVGTRTSAHRGTVEFFRDVLGLAVELEETDFTVLRVEDGASVEIFGPTSPYNQHLAHPVVGFAVADLAAAADELVGAGIEIVLPVQGGESGSWLHFRAPDGFVYELNQGSEPGSEESEPPSEGSAPLGRDPSSSP